jgi:hypothetical protein
MIMIGVSAWGQSRAPGQFGLKFENDVVAVYELTLPPGASAAAFQSAHDTFWIALSDAAVKFARNDATRLDVNFQAGDTRFFPSFEIKSIANLTAREFRGLMITLKARGLTTGGCDCTGNTGKTICGCKGATHLESLWAFSLGEVTLAGTSLAVGEGYRSAALRDDMLLLAVTDVDLQDQVTTPPLNQTPTAFHLKAGDIVWINSGRHQFKNLGTTLARFVTVEF